MDNRTSRKNGRTARAPRKRTGRRGQRRASARAGPDTRGGQATKIQEPYTGSGMKMAAMPLFANRSKRSMLPYYAVTSLSVPNTSTGVSYVYSANGLYDPDISGTGSQPTGFDQMMTFYEHYTVFRAKCTAVFRNYSTAIAPVVYLSVKGDVTNVSQPESIMTQGNTVSAQLQTAGNFNSLQELSLSVDVRKFLGFDDLMDSNVARGDLASNPAEGAFFHVGAFENGVPATGTVYVQVRIEYYAVFTEPRTITPSLSAGFRKLLLAEHSVQEKEPTGFISVGDSKCPIS